MIFYRKNSEYLKTFEELYFFLFRPVSLFLSELPFFLLPSLSFNLACLQFLYFFYFSLISLFFKSPLSDSLFLLFYLFRFLDPLSVSFTPSLYFLSSFLTKSLSQLSSPLFLCFTLTYQLCDINCENFLP
jgi:hypothetical protein